MSKKSEKNQNLGFFVFYLNNKKVQFENVFF